MPASWRFRSISRAEAVRRALIAGAAVAALAMPGAPARAALLNLTCSMRVVTKDAIHPKKYVYYTSVDEDAGRASDDAGAYLLWPTVNGRGFVWFVEGPDGKNVVWTTQYYLNAATLELYAEDESELGKSGSSSGVCDAV